MIVRIGLEGVWVGALLGLCGSTAFSQAPPEEAMHQMLEKEGKQQPEQAVSVPDLSAYDADSLREICAQLYKTIASQRAETKQLQLELAATRQNLESASSYLKGKGLYSDYLDWSGNQEKARELQKEKEAGARREQILQQIRDERAAQQRRLQELQEAERKAIEEAPKWDLTYSLGFIKEKGKDVVYVDTVTGEVLISDTTQYDPSNVMIRGVFTNQAKVPYRYTFEIGIGGKQPSTIFKPSHARVIGSWKYQTPVLAPGELHNFEVKVPLVADISEVANFEIGNITADRPPAKE